jgi:hypothetical protein
MPTTTHLILSPQSPRIRNLLLIHTRRDRLHHPRPARRTLLSPPIIARSVEPRGSRASLDRSAARARSL